MQNKIDSFYKKNKPTVDKFYYRIGFYEPSMFFPAMVQILNSLLKNIDASTEYKLTKHQFYFYGICPGCQQTQLNKCV